MAIVSKAGGNQGGGGGGGAASDGAQAAPRTNLPQRTSPITGRRAEFENVAAVFAGRAAEKQATRVEISGRSGVGASWTALELAWRNGARYPGGCWYVHLGMGDDWAWADVAAVRGQRITSDVPGLVKKLREFVLDGPKALLVLDGATSAEQVHAQVGEDGRADGPDILLVTEEPLGAFESLVHVTDVPERAPRRIAHGYFFEKDGEAATPPAVRSTDGLALTASLAARLAVIHDGKQGPIDVPNLQAAVNGFIPFIHQNPLALEGMLIASVAHPVRIPMDGLFRALVRLRATQDIEVKPEQVIEAMHQLIARGMLSVDDPQRVSMHPLIQEIVRGMVSSERDLQYARQMLATGLIDELQEAISEKGLDILRASLHQLRFLLPHLEGDIGAIAGQALAAAEQAGGMAA